MLKAIVVSMECLFGFCRVDIDNEISSLPWVNISCSTLGHLVPFVARTQKNTCNIEVIKFSLVIPNEH